VKEISIGPTSLMAILTIEFTRGTNPDFAILLAFLGGCIEFLMGLLDLGKVSILSYLYLHHCSIYIEE
jgi:sodium-independent sulfate anion transporter 11